MIRAIIFDWGGVLIDDIAPFIVTYTANYFNVCRKDLAVQIDKNIFCFDKGVISEDIFWEKVCEAISIQKPHVRSLWGEAFKAGYSEKQDVLRLIDCLKNKGYKIGLLSNTEIPAVEFFYQSGYTQFDAAVFSCQEGICKPKENIYEMVLERLGVEPIEAIFIDDKEENVHGAKNIGLYTILFVNPEQMRKELELLLKKENN